MVPFSEKNDARIVHNSRLYLDLTAVDFIAQQETGAELDSPCRFIPWGHVQIGTLLLFITLIIIMISEKISLLLKTKLSVSQH